MKNGYSFLPRAVEGMTRTLGSVLFQVHTKSSVNLAAAVVEQVLEQAQ